jgi:molecular chaperone HscB
MENFFEALGLPERYDLSPQSIRQAYLGLVKALHPDRHGLGMAEEQAEALRRTALVNRAMKQLTDPYLRLQHLLALAPGVEPKAPTPPPDFLMEMMEMNEALTDAPGQPPATVVHRLEALRAEADAEISAQMALHDAAPLASAERNEALKAVTAPAARLAYLLRMQAAMPTLHPR